MMLQERTNVRSQLVEKVELYIKSSMGGGTPPLHFAKIPLFLVGADVLMRILQKILTNIVVYDMI